MFVSSAMCLNITSIQPARKCASLYPQRDVASLHVLPKLRRQRGPPHRAIRHRQTTSAAVQPLLHPLPQRPRDLQLHGPPIPSEEEQAFGITRGRQLAMKTVANDHQTGQIVSIVHFRAKRTPSVEAIERAKQRHPSAFSVACILLKDESRHLPGRE